MNLEHSAEDLKFAEEVRAFISENLPRELAERVRLEKTLEKEDFVFWQAILGKKGWLTFTWPREYGGPGWTLTQRLVFETICAEMHCPIIQPFGPRMVGPVIYTFGNKRQQQRFLPGIRDSSAWWCQGYSEPQSGSDLASLTMRAVRDGDRYIVSGQKIWTTYAHYADWAFCLVRTSTHDRPQKGISFLLIDMTAPGITVQPILMFEGSHSFNTVFFDNVEVPVENLVGEEGQGWTYAKFLLELERVDNAGIGEIRAAMARLRHIARTQRENGRPLSQQPVFRSRMIILEAQFKSLELTALRALSRVSVGGSPGPIASMLKIRGTEIAQSIAQLASEALGYSALPADESVGADYAAPAATMYFWRRGMSIYGGANEIQKNILARQLLGM